MDIEQLKEIISEYFFEASPAIVNFLAYSKKHSVDVGFDTINFYYLPERYLNKFPYKVIFMKNGINCSDEVLENKTFATMLKILDKLPQVLDRDQRNSLPDWVPAGSQDIGIEGFLFDCFNKEMSKIIGRNLVDSPKLVSQMHDDDEIIMLN